MLIQALCDYYDILKADGKVLPDGYSKVKVHYVISLTEKGNIDGIIDYQNTVEIRSKTGKITEKKVPREEIMPLRTEKTGIDANIVEHRPFYLFGEWGVSNIKDKDKARKSHEAFVESNLEFTEGIDSPVVQAYRKFILNWKPEEQTENEYLLSLGSSYKNNNYAFCLSGSPDALLHKDNQLVEKWNEYYKKKKNENDCIMAQCAVTGKYDSIARLHNKIKGIEGGRSTGNVLVGFNNPSDESYENKQSYNSNISESVMKKYTEALNVLLNNKKHKIVLDETTIVFWAMNKQEDCEDLFLGMLFGQSEKYGAEQTETMLQGMFQETKRTGLTEKRLETLDLIGENVEFYILGLKPNPPRISMKFLFKKKYADVLWNIAKFQREVQLSEKVYPVYLGSLKKELVSPKSNNEKVNPALLARVFESIIYGSDYPLELLDTIVRRVKTDAGFKEITFSRERVRTGIIKACINRNNSKEELKMGLDRENVNQAYLCGRLFAVMEKLQQEASNNTLNRTIKDAYFASAASKPTLVFPKLIMLAQNHLKKVKYPVYYNKLIGEIMEPLTGGFPETFDLKDQGRFIVGYYQQTQDFYTSNNDTKEELPV